MKNRPKRKRPNKLFSKINLFLLFFFILLLPTQLGKHFFLPFSYLSGVRVDYLAPTLYLTDIVAFLIFVFNLKTVGGFLRQKKVLVVLGLLLLNVIVSLSTPVSIYRYLKIIEFLVIMVVFSKHILEERSVLIALSITALMETILTLTQFINKQSVQGIFYFLGERYFNLSAPGIAKAYFDGVEILRPYGTFSHPNSLAGFYLLVYFFVLTNKKFNNYFIFKAVFLFLSSFLILISFSKIAILTYLSLTIYYLLSTIKKCRVCLLSQVTTITVLSLIFLRVQADPQTIDKRLELIRNAAAIIFKHPAAGVGVGNYLIAQTQFTSKYLYFFNQPVHNVFLLVLAETGLLVSGLILFQLINQLKRWLKKTVGFYIITVIVITGMFDHYWLTLPQNFLLLGVVLGSL